jgi:hypothetical protein
MAAAEESQVGDDELRISAAVSIVRHERGLLQTSIAASLNQLVLRAREHASIHCAPRSGDLDNSGDSSWN